MSDSSSPDTRPRAQDLGITIGVLPPGVHNAITDVPGVRVGHVTLVQGEGKLTPGSGPVRTGVTAIVPHDGNIFREKVTAAVHVINGFGKSLGLLQVQELGVIESPILLTNTLNVWSVADALVDYLAQQNPEVRSFNPVVGECNDARLNDVLGRHVKREHVFQALESDHAPSTEEGNVGAGTGMTGFGWKGGIGTASRLCGPEAYTVGSLVVNNTGEPADLRIGDIPVGRHLLPPAPDKGLAGSIMIILATNAPVSSRQLGRIARRATFGLARTGGIAHHSSGDYVIAFSTVRPPSSFPETDLTPLFRGAIESTEEAIVNSLLRAETLMGRDGNTRYALPIEELKKLLGPVDQGTRY